MNQEIYFCHRPKARFSVACLKDGDFIYVGVCSASSTNNFSRKFAKNKLSNKLLNKIKNPDILIPNTFKIQYRRSINEFFDKLRDKIKPYPKEDNKIDLLLWRNKSTEEKSIIIHELILNEIAINV